LETYLMTEDLGEIEYLGQRHHRWVEKEAARVVEATIAYIYRNQPALAKLILALPPTFSVFGTLWTVT
jgi:hypothetical protein